MIRNPLVRMFAVLALTAAACSGDDGAAGAQGPAGPQGQQGNQGDQGTPGQNGMSPTTGDLKLVIDGVATATVDGVTTSTVTFTVYPAAAVCPGGTCDDTLASLGQKTFYATEYDAATNTFTTAKSFNFTGFKFKGLVDGSKGAQYTAKKASPSFAPETSQHAMVYAYIADQTVLPNKGSYRFYDNVASASKVYGTVEYVSAANVSGCEKCHGAPYSKHGYRQGAVAGLPDMASCKACHTDQRAGGHQDWQMMVDDAGTYAALPSGMTADQKAKYAYTATVMNDTHMSHAMEFAYPQSMANCVTCHEGKLDVVLADKFFTLKTCKSCHPMDGVGGTDSKRAPALNAKLPAGGWHPALTDAVNCGTCHSVAGGMKTLKQVHSGYDKKIYTADGKKLSESFKVEITGASLAGSLLTIKFKATEATDIAGFAATDIAPTVMVAPYGWDTKDWAAGYQNWTLAAVGVAPTAKLGWALVSDAGANWEVTLDLATGTGTPAWTSLITAGSVKRLEIAIRPVLKTTFAGDTAATTLALDAVSKTFDVTANSGAGALVDFYAAIVDPAKCNACHDALATTFHSGDRGGSVVACRMCHTVRSGGSHLEMQSRSIDSYVHAIHSMQPFDPGDVDFANPVEAMHYNHHVESTYPNFTTLNCESCHNPGTYEVPTMDMSLPSLLSGSDTVAGRSIAGVPVYVVGPASRACGACHRAELINEDQAGALAAFNQHTATFGTLIRGTTVAADNTALLDAVTSNLMAQIAGGPAATVPAPAGTQIESCSVCHPNAGAEHQAAYRRWQDGL